MLEKVRRPRPHLLPALLAGVVAAGATLWMSGDPAPVSAAPFTCRISQTFVMPTMEVLAEEYGEGHIPEFFNFAAGVDARCRSRLVKGVYVYRAKVTMSTRLNAGWPGDLYEYPQSIDSSFRLFPGYTHGADRFGNQSSPKSLPAALYPLQWGYTGALPPSGTWTSELTELCVGERCTFGSEHTGTFSDPTGEGDFGIELDIDYACVPMEPDDLTQTIRCRDAGEDFPMYPGTYFHPGLSGAEFSVNAELYFEPLMTWRR